jgi:Tfp pilus assembly protein PilX
MRTLRNRRGFALPMTIMVIVVLTAALTSAFVATASETTTNVALRGQSRAFMVAQMGLERFLENPNELALCPKCDSLRATPAVDVFRQEIDGDSVYITVTRIRHQSAPTVPAVYFIQARGVDKRSKLSGRLATVDAERSVGMYAQWNTNTMQVRSAWTSLTGLDKNGTAGLLSGKDQCGEAPAIAGTTVPKGQFTHDGGSGWAEGNPPVDTSMTASALADSMKIDWNSIINNNTMPADITVPANAFPSEAWFDADTSRWPVIRITASGYALPNRGRGIIIAEGDFVISGSNMWDGVVLVGGKLVSNGSNTVAGATISGLNVLLDGASTPGESHLDDGAAANGQKIYQYSSCKVARATKSLQRYRVLANTWADNLPSW